MRNATAIGLLLTTVLTGAAQAQKPFTVPYEVARQLRPPTSEECVRLFKAAPDLAKPKPKVGLFGDETPRSDAKPGSTEAMAETCHALAEKNKSDSVFGDLPGPDYLRQQQPDLSDTMTPGVDGGSESSRQLRIAARFSQQAEVYARRGQWNFAVQLYKYAAQDAPKDLTIQRKLIDARKQMALQVLKRRQEEQQKLKEQQEQRRNPLLLP
jgi:hypothetical protein